MPRPGQPVVRENIGQFMLSEDHDKSEQVSEHVLSTMVPINVPPSTGEHVLFHAPQFPASNNNIKFDGSWAVMQSVRSALREPYPAPDIPRIFDIKQCEDKTKGKGMFAKVDIAAGHVFLFEHPVLLHGQNIPIGAGSKGAFYKTLLNRLPDPEMRAQVMALDNCKTPEEAGPIEGIMRTNGFGVELDGASDEMYRIHSGVFLQMSRCNHSCSPNTSYAWDQRTYSMRLFALRRIAAGEEITLTYIPKEFVREERRKRLKEMYKFGCFCKWCSLSGEALRESDAHREYIATWHTREDGPIPFQTWRKMPIQQAPPWKDVLAAWMHVVECHDKESIEVPTDALEAVAAMYAVVGDLENYRKWGRRLSDGLRIAGMHSMSPLDLAKIRACEETIRNPALFEFWKTRTA